MCTKFGAIVKEDFKKRTDNEYIKIDTVCIAAGTDTITGGWEILEM